MPWLNHASFLGLHLYGTYTYEDPYDLHTFLPYAILNHAIFLGL